MPLSLLSPLFACPLTAALREDLLVEIQDLKKKLLGAEEALAAMRSEAQRMETDGLRQQKRIEQLLHLSEGTRANGGKLIPLLKLLCACVVGVSFLVLPPCPQLQLGGGGGLFHQHVCMG